MAPLPIAAAFTSDEGGRGGGEAAPYDPAPSRSAFLTVLAVFGFFGLCFLVVAAWIRCVVGIEEGLRTSLSQSPRRVRRGAVAAATTRRDRKHRGLGGFQEWYYRRRRSNPAAAPQPPPLPPPQLSWRDTKRMRTSPPPPYSATEPNYNTFSVPESSSNPRRTRSKSVDQTSHSGSSSRRDTMRRSLTMPASGTSNKVLKSSAAGKHKRGYPGSKTRRKDGGGGHAQIRAWTPTEARGHVQWGWDRGLDVVVEETGSTPER